MTHVAVLMGGVSSEREVSLVSGEECARALESRGFRVSRVEVGEDLPLELLELRPDVVFNALHGRFGEDGRIQGMLDLLGIPYTHSGVRASAIAMHKPTARRLFAAAGLPVPEGVVCSFADVCRRPPFPAPFVVKPVDEGSSLGVVLVFDAGFRELEAAAFAGEQPVLVERYVAGLELTCAVLDGEPLAVTEVASRSGFYDYRAKYTPGYAQHRLPAPIAPEIYDRAMEIAAEAHRLLDCRGLTRADLRFDPARGREGLFLLEINTQPGMTPLSLAPEQAAHRGLSFPDLVVRLVELARCDR